MAVAMDLAGRTAVVTGAGGGIGGAVCATLARAGAKIVLSDRDPALLEQRRNGLDRPDAHHVIAADLGDIAQCDNLVAQSFGACGRIDIMVNAAAVLHRKQILDVDVECFEESLRVNLTSIFRICQKVIPAMIGTGRGSIINFASPSAFTGGKIGAIHYGAAKAGVIALSRGLAVQFAKSGVRTNVLCPGTTDTDMIRGTLTEDQIAQHISGVPIGRLAQPEEIANGVLFLASDLASFVNGCVLTVDGGASLRP